jgi:hypothetical protein
MDDHVSKPIRVDELARGLSAGRPPGGSGPVEAPTSRRARRHARPPGHQCPGYEAAPGEPGFGLERRIGTLQAK